MLKETRLVFWACMLSLSLCLATYGDPNSATPEYVFSTVDDNGWIDAGHNPDINILSWSFDNMDSDGTGYLIAGPGDGSVTYRFDAGQGNFIDEIQLGLHGWANDPDYWVAMEINGVEAWRLLPTGEFHHDGGYVLPVPSQIVDVTLYLNNDIIRPYVDYSHSIWEYDASSCWLAAHSPEPRRDFTASSQYGANQRWCHVVNGSGMHDGVNPNFDGPYHDNCPTEARSVWHTATADPGNDNPAGIGASKGWAYWDFAEVFELGVMDVWNFNYNSTVNLTGRGFKNTRIHYRASESDPWTELTGTAGTPHWNATESCWVFEKATGSSSYAANTHIDFGGVEARYVVLTCLTDWENTNWPGLSEVHFNIEGYDPCAVPGPTTIYSTEVASGAGYEFAAHVTEMELYPTIPVDVDGNFSLQCPPHLFTDWTVFSFNALQRTFSTQFTRDRWFSGPPAKDSTATLAIPFRFEDPLVSCSLEYGSIVQSYGDNPGYVQLDIVTDTGTTMIYCHESPDFPIGGTRDSYNYDPCGGVPVVLDPCGNPVSNYDGAFRASTDISDLVAGEREFELMITARTGWSNDWFRGGHFLPSPDSAISSGDWDFYMTGQTQYDPCNPAPVLPDDEFVVRVPANKFSTWVQSMGGTLNGMATFYAGQWMTGSDEPDEIVSCEIPFDFPRPLQDAVLDYGSVVKGYGGVEFFNIGYVDLEVITDDGTTLIYHHESPDNDPVENYNYDGAVPTGGDDYFRASTDISDLVAGKSSFRLVITCRNGWSTYLHNGGQFLPGVWGVEGSEFRLSGHVVPAPTACGDPYTYYLTGDLGGTDCQVDIIDVSVLAEQWLQCSDPANPECTQPWE
ncbi:MAG: hypothetical protein JW936_01990 [Sedimentisphaerales bacterium]|nr:hypothetical protein [Sedimentisphaerales bacterium]